MSKSNEQLVSIVMPCYKMGRYISEALESVSKQAYSNWELIVVDDCGPDDGTVDAISKFKENHLNHLVKYIRLEVNSGVSIARNTGIQSACGEFIAFLDPDDFWKENHLFNHFKIFEKNKAADLVCCSVAMFQLDDKENISLWNIPDWYKLNLPASLGTGCFIIPSAVVIRRKALLEVGNHPFDPQLHPCEDWDLWIRLAKNLCKFIFTDEATCYYRRHPHQVTSNSGLCTDSDDILAKKHLGFFLNQHNYMMQEYFTKTNYLFERNHGPIYRLIRYIDIIINKLIKTLK